jgi:DNA mismatch endonuclease (patch repair protein)
MQANRRCDTAPELRFRSALHQRGFRFRKDYRVDLQDLRVRIDIAFPRAMVAGFVDGCFWHRCPEHGSDPCRNGDFWQRKLDRNVERDRRVDAELKAAGWKVVRVWEHEPVEAGADRIGRVVSQATARSLN